MNAVAQLLLNQANALIYQGSVDSLLQEMEWSLSYFVPKVSPLALLDNLQHFLKGNTYTHGNWQVACSILYSENNSRNSTQFVITALAPWLNEEHALDTTGIGRHHLRTVNKNVGLDNLPLTNVRSTCNNAIFITQHEGLCASSSLGDLLTCLWEQDQVLRRMK